MKAFLKFLPMEPFASFSAMRNDQGNLRKLLYSWAQAQPRLPREHLSSFNGLGPHFLELGREPPHGRHVKDSASRAQIKEQS
jgi:hypothetical protein